MEWHENQIQNHLLIHREEEIRYLGYGAHFPESEIIEELADCEKEMIAIMKPKFIYQKTELVWDKECIKIAEGRIDLPGNDIKEHLKGCEFGILSCATLGKEVDERIDIAQKEDMLQALFFDAIANSAIEELRLFMEKQIAKENKLYEVVWQFGVGYGDFPLTLQPKLLEELQAKEKIGLTVNNRCILTPLKSVSGIIGLKKQRDFTSATNCKQRNCLFCNQREHCIYQKKI